MAGETKQSTNIKAIRDIAHKNWASPSKEESLKDAEMIKTMRTTFEDSTSKTLRVGTQMVEDAFEVFDSAYKKMVRRECETEEMVRTHVSKMKDKAGQIADALGKIEKLTGPDFETKLQRLERFANAVEILDRLNRTGKLAEVAASLGKLSNT